MDYELTTAATRQSRGARRLPWLLLALLFAFTLGMLGSSWFESTIRGSVPVLEDKSAKAEAARINAIEARVSEMERQSALPSPDIPPGLGNRLSALESREDASPSGELRARVEALSAEIGRTSASIEAGDAQLKDLFLLAVLRRMVEAGRPIGPIEKLVVDRFSVEDASAVEAILAWSAAPQTEETLAARLIAIDAKTVAAKETGWWARFRKTLSGLVTVRDESASPSSEQALVAAQQAMVTRDIDLAVSELQRAPINRAERQWIADAALLRGAQDALFRLENAVLKRTMDKLSANASAPVAGGISAPPVNAAPQNDTVAH